MMRTRHITYTNACRQSNSAHITKERICRETLVTLEKKKKSLETEMLGILDRFCHSNGPLSQEFKEKKHNYTTLIQEIAYMEGKVNYHLQQQQHVEGG